MINLISKSCLISFVIICLACSSKNPDWFDLEEMDVWKDNDLTNDLTLDNIIYEPEHNFIYEITNKNKNGDLQKCELFFNEECKTNKSVDCIDYHFTNTTGKYIIDYINLYIYKTKGHNSLSNSQTIIKYDYFDNQERKILYGEQTGVGEDSVRVFLHPPRSYCFSILEFAPFPHVFLPLHVEKTWETQLDIPNSYIQELENPPAIATSATMQNSYKVVSEEWIDTKLGKLKCFKIIGTGISELGTSKTTLYFNEQYGFVNIEYHLFEGSFMNLKLIDVKT